MEYSPDDLEEYACRNQKARRDNAEEARIVTGWHVTAALSMGSRAELAPPIGVF
jgi:hypothetical protein